MKNIENLLNLSLFCIILFASSLNFTSAADSALINALDKTAETCFLPPSQIDKYKNLDISKSVSTLTPQQTDALQILQQKLQGPLKTICDPGNPQKPNPRRRLGTFGFDSLKSIVITPCMASQGITASIALECFAIGGFMDMATFEKLFPAFTFGCLEANLGYAVATSVVTCLIGGTGNSNSKSLESSSSAGNGDPGQDPPPGPTGIPQCDVGGSRDAENDVCSADQLGQPQDSPNNSNDTWDPKASERRRRLGLKNNIQNLNTPKIKPPFTYELTNGKECAFKRKPGDQSKWAKLADDLFWNLDSRFKSSAEEYMNNGRPLPQAPKGTYKKVDVYPTGCNFSKNTNRGTYRLVKNTATGEMYFTPDHYSTFFKLKVQSAGEYVLSKI